MTDYFALLEQPRRPWLAVEELKQIFHAKTLRDHPDAQNSDSSAFTELNEAYQVLRDPKRRLQYLLKLSGAILEQSPAIPAAINELFPTVAGLTRTADHVSEQTAQAKSALSRSLLKPQLLEVQNKLQETLRRLQELREQALVRLQSIQADDYLALQNLQGEFSYLDRWIAELEERQLKLRL